MSAQSKGLIAELSANCAIPGKQLEAIMTAYPSCWGYAAPLKSSKTGKPVMRVAATKLPQGFSAKDIQDMKAQMEVAPEMMEFFGGFTNPDTDEVCLQPFPVLEDASGNVTLCLFMEGDFDHWAEEDEPNLTPEYICYRDKIAPLIAKLETTCKGDLSAILKELDDPVYKDILEGTYAERGVMYFLANNGSSQMIEGGNTFRKDEDWGSTSNEIPEVQHVTDTTVEEETVTAKPELSLAEKRKLRQQAADAAAKKTVEGVHATTATPKSVTSQKNTTLAEQGVKDSLKNSTTAATAKGPFLFTLPQTIKTEAEAKKYWQTNFGTCPDMWKHKDKDGNWAPSYTAGFPYEKAAKGSVIKEKYNSDGSPRTSAKGFAGLDDIATGKTDVATATSTGDGDTRPATAPVKLPVIPAAVRDKVISDMLKLDLKSREVMTNEEIKTAEAKHPTLFAQLKNMPVEDLWRMSYAEIDRLNRSYPDFGSVWLFSLRNYQIQNWKTAEEPKKETGEQPVHDKPELTLAEKRALRNKAAA